MASMISTQGFPGVEPGFTQLQEDLKIANLVSSGQFSSVTQLCRTLCEPVDCSTPGFPVHHQLPEFTQTHVH